MQAHTNSIATMPSSEKTQMIVSSGKFFVNRIRRLARPRFSAVLTMLFLFMAMAMANLGAATIEVQVGQEPLKFTPPMVTIQVGDTVQWNFVSSGHTTTSGTPGSPDGLWDSGIQNPGSTFSFTFTEAGSFPYFCTPHGACCGMVISYRHRSWTCQVDWLS